MFENGNYRRRRRMKRPYRTTPYRPGPYFGPDYNRGVLGSHPTNFGSNPNITPRFDHRFIYLYIYQHLLSAFHN